MDEENVDTSTDNSGDGSSDNLGDQTQDPSQGPTQDPSYDPTQDGDNYDDNGNYIGPGAYDDQGNWTDPFGQGWQGQTPPGVPVFNGQAQQPGTNAAGKSVGLLGRLGQAFSGSNLGNTLRGIGSAVGGAGQAAAQGRLSQAQLGLQANQQNIAGMSASEQALMNRATTEEKLRNDAITNAARANYVQSGGFQSPFAPSRPNRFGSQYMQTMGNVGNQAAATLANPSQFGAGSWGAAPKYTPIPPSGVPGATGTTPGGLSNVGNVVGPGLSVLGALFGGRNPNQQPQGGQQ